MLLGGERFGAQGQEVRARLCRADGHLPCSHVCQWWWFLSTNAKMWLHCSAELQAAAKEWGGEAKAAGGDMLWFPISYKPCPADIDVDCVGKTLVYCRRDLVQAALPTIFSLLLVPPNVETAKSPEEMHQNVNRGCPPPLAVVWLKNVKLIKGSRVMVTKLVSFLISKKKKKRGHADGDWQVVGGGHSHKMCWCVESWYSGITMVTS